MKRGEQMPKFTRDVVEKLMKPKVDALHFDEGSRGFFLRTYASGAPAVFGVKYSVGGRPRRMNLGLATVANLAPMRDLAETVRAKAKLGQDTLGEQRAERAKPRVHKLGALVPRYLSQRKADLRPRSYAAAAMYLTKHWKELHGEPVDAVTRKAVVGVVDDIAERRGRVAADRARTALSTFYMWAIDKGYVDTNPTMYIKERAPAGSRERVLSGDEIAAVWKACPPEDDFNRIVRLLILTGCRKREIAEIEWSEVNFEKRQASLPAGRVKNAHAFVLPLADEALDVLHACPAIAGRTRVFGSFSWSRYKDELDARLPADTPHWTLHDLRRSFVTHVAELGLAPPHVVEACVNHQSGKGGIAGVYNKATYANEKRQAFDLWGRHVADLVAGRKCRVIPMRRGKVA
jgi:integrase